MQLHINCSLTAEFNGQLYQCDLFEEQITWIYKNHTKVRIELVLGKTHTLKPQNSTQWRNVIWSTEFGVFGKASGPAWSQGNNRKFWEKSKIFGSFQGFTLTLSSHCTVNCKNSKYRCSDVKIPWNPFRWKWFPYPKLFQIAATESKSNGALQERFYTEYIEKDIAIYHGTTA